MERLLNIGKSKSDTMYDAAMSAASAFAALLSLRSEGDVNIGMEKNIFHKIFPSDPNSPAVHWIEEGKQYIIYYPCKVKTIRSQLQRKVQIH